MSTHSLLFIEPMEVAVIGKARLHFKNAFKLQWLVCDMENHANVFASVTSRVVMLTVLLVKPENGHLSAIYSMLTSCPLGFNAEDSFAFNDWLI